jgi:hypothetical protein
MPHTPGHFNDSEFMVGCTVFTRDGEALGTIKEVGTGIFKIDAAMKPDYWLSTGHVASSAPDQIVLTFDENQLGDYKVDNPNETMTAERTRTTASSGRRTRSR